MSHIAATIVGDMLSMGILALLVLSILFYLWRATLFKKNKPTFDQPLSTLQTSRKYHKWLMLFLGAQFIIWSVTGAYMVIFNIDYIHGDTLVVNHQDKIVTDNIKFSLKEVLQRYPKAENLGIGKFIEKDVYRFIIKNEGGDDLYLLDASDGKQLTPLNKSIAIKAAKYLYTGSGNVASVEKITDNPPFELSRRMHNALPAWRVNFNDFGSPSLYISATNGKLLAKRHEFWRIFDWMFRFHIMDYNESEIDNVLLFCITLIGVFAAVSGLLLTYLRIFKSNKNQSNTDELVKKSDIS
jgi:Cu(I)/Ag(I) efflux system membrane protein CusA/SilA